MRRYRRLRIALFLLTLVGAQAALGGTEPTAEEAARVRLAEELVNQLLGAEDQMEARIDRILEQGLAGLDDETAGILQDWMKEIQPMVLDTYLQNRRASIAIYAERLTLDELAQAVDFYNTPLGQKLSAAQEAIEIAAVRNNLPPGELGGPDPGQRKEEAHGMEQARAVADLRNVGTAMMIWLTDQVSGDAAPLDLEESEGTSLRVVLKEGEEPVSYTPISHARLQALLEPRYIQVIPERDPWGHPYEFFLNGNLLGANVLAVRSAGRDGEFATEPYSVGGFDADDLDQDIVWVDGYFVRWPEAR